MTPVHSDDLEISLNSSANSLSQLSPSISSPVPLPETPSPGRFHEPSALDAPNSNSSKLSGGILGHDLTLDLSPYGRQIHSGLTRQSAIDLTSASATSSDIVQDNSGSCNVVITVGSNFDNNQNQVDKLKVSRNQARGHFGLILDILDTANVHHVDHLWEDLLEEGGEYLGLCSALEILLPNGVIKPSDGLAAKELCARLQSCFSSIRGFTLRGDTSSLTTPWDWRNILPFHKLTGLELGGPLSMDDGVDILRQCPELTECGLKFQDIDSVLTHDAHPLDFHRALQRLKVSSCVDLQPFFLAVGMRALKEVDLHLTGQQAAILGYAIPWEKLKLMRLHCSLPEGNVQAIQRRCRHDTKIYHCNLTPAC